MTKNPNQLDLSPLTPNSRREIRDFYHFLLERGGRRQKNNQAKLVKRSFTDLCGQLDWKGDAVAAQIIMRNEW